MNKIELIFKKIIDCRWYILLLFGFVAIFGFLSLKNIKLDAIPDITNKQVVINTKTGAMDPSRVEKSVTYPVESALYGLQGLVDMRSLSKFGLSQLVLIFRDDVDIYFAREQVLQRLSSLRDELPPNISPTIAPLTTGIGEIIMYRVYSKIGDNNLTKLRTAQQLVIARELKKVSGVAEVDTMGGFERELHLNINSARMIALGMNPQKLINQLKTIGENYGGGYIEKDDKQAIVRTYPNLKNYQDIMNIPVKINHNGDLINLDKLIDVRQDYSQRLGIATYNGQESVIGTVFLQSGENARDVLIKVKNEINKINQKSEDIAIEILYDRQFLTDSTIKVVIKNLLEGILLVIGVLCILLGNLRIGLIVAVSIPFCILILAIFMRIFNISANLMSLGAIDFGLLVDSSVVLIERIISGLYFYKNQDEKTNQIAKITASVVKPVFLGIIIIILVYVPILLFSGIEGKTFKPMAINVAISLFASVLIAFLLMPVLAFFFIKNGNHGESKIFDYILVFYDKILQIVLEKPIRAIIPCGLFFILSSMAFFRMSVDFLPELNEGDIVYTIVAPEGASLSKTKEIIQEIEKNILQNPEVEKTFSRIGTSQAGLDPMPQNAGDIFILLSEENKINAPAISSVIYKKLADSNMQSYKITETQPIKMRFNEMLEGSRADISLKIFGDDLNILMNATNQIISLLKDDENIKQIEEDFINSIRKTSTIDIIPNYSQIMRYQVSMSDVNSGFADAMSGFKLGNFYESEFPISILLHLDEKNRNKIESIGGIPIGLSDGGSFPLSKIAEIKEGQDITSIPRIFGKRYSSLSIYLNNTNYAKFISEAEKKIKQEKIVPENYRLEWSGRFKNLNSAKKQIFLVIPVILLLIFGLLYKMFKNIKNVLIIFTSVPFGLSGGVFLLFICDIPVTISVYIGFIALIGISLLNSIILIDTINKENDLRKSCISRLRPIIMTALVASLGFVPMAFATGIGSEVQQPLAITVIGGIISSTIATIILTPILVKKFLKKDII